MLTQLKTFIAWLIPSTLLMSSPLLAQDYGPEVHAAVYADNGRSFRSGQDCTRLGAINARSIWLSVVESDESGQESFCQPERYYDCRDYGALVAPYLKIEWADNGYMCRIMRLR